MVVVLSLLLVAVCLLLVTADGVGGGVVDVGVGLDGVVAAVVVDVVGVGGCWWCWW